MNIYKFNTKIKKVLKNNQMMEIIALVIIIQKFIKKNF